MSLPVTAKGDISSKNVTTFRQPSPPPPVPTPRAKTLRKVKILSPTKIASVAKRRRRRKEKLSPPAAAATEATSQKKRNLYSTTFPPKNNRNSFLFVCVDRQPGGAPAPGLHPERLPADGGGAGAGNQGQPGQQVLIPCLAIFFIRPCGNTGGGIEWREESL